MSIQIKDKVALVTGGNRGIGKTIVEELLTEGAAKVYLAVRDIESTNDLVSRYGDRVQPVHIDVANGDTVKAAASIANDVNIVVNNAGVLEVAQPLDEHAEDAFKRELNINALGLIRIAQAFVPVIEKNSVNNGVEGETKGAIVQLNSVASIKNFAALTTYSASKAASYSITQGLKETLAQKDIAVLSVHPGPIATDMASKAGMDGLGEPPQVVAKAIVDGLKNGTFHVFPDNMAKEFEAGYASYATNVIEPVMVED